MPDIFLKGGDANPSDIRLRDPTVAHAGGGVTITADLAATEAQDTAAFSTTRISVGALAATEAQDVAAFSATLVHVADLAATEAPDVAAFSASIVAVATPEEATHTGGKGDNDGRRRRKTLRVPFKPTGLVDRPARKDIEQRVSESREIAAEVAAERSARESAQEQEIAEGAAVAPSLAAQVSLPAMDREIRDLLHKEMQAQDMRIILALLAAVV